MIYIKPQETPRRSGAAAVEFAAVLPLLVMLILGIWEVGRLVDMGEIVNNAAREDRQTASGAKPVGPDTVDSVERTVKDYLRNAGLSDTSDVGVTVENLTQPAITDPRLARQGDRLKLTLSVPVDRNRWSFASRINSSPHMIASVEWRCLLDIPVDVNTTLPVDPLTN